MNDTLRIFCKNTGSFLDVAPGTSLLEIKEILGIKMPYIIVSARANNKSESLHYRLYRPKTVEFVDISESAGMRCYVRSLCFILSKAVYDVYPKAQVHIKHPISKGYYVTISGKDNRQIKDIDLQRIKNRMREIIDSNVPFDPLEDETEQVVGLFREQGFDDKALLLETSGRLYSKYYRLDDYEDYFYGTLVPYSSYVALFDIEPFYDGFLLRIPNREHPVELEPVIDQSKMFNVYKEQTTLLNIIKLDTVGDLNMANREGRMSEIIKISEALQERSIAEFSNKIKERYNEGVRIVFIAGPSSSGKTTFRKRLEVQLMTQLLKPVGLSLDDYFVDREQTPLDENGEYDFESLYALDLDLFNSDLNKLLNGEKVSLPAFNFTTGKREYRGHSLQIDAQTVLVIEGIHGLNPELTPQIDPAKKFLIYVSALTAISLDNHNWIPTTDNRLLRRLIRDYKYRNYSAADTLSRWKSVRKGEEKWIFPFQENADVMFNSAMLYELAALKKYAEPIWREVPQKAPEDAEANR
ncbi:MAG: nucleoside kinase, partial [Prevotella sp.]|nr:nucleoside kinase [Prevotella sp.]